MTPSSPLTPLAGIAHSLQAAERVKSPYYVGIDMLNTAHDYQKLHYILMHFRAEKASRRIWKLVVDQDEIALVLQLLKQCLSSLDRVIVAKGNEAEGVAQRIAA